jgi:MFS family permease
MCLAVIGLRTLMPALPAAAWRVLVADGLSAWGSGLTLPFAMVYLHAVRGLDLVTAGAAVACIGLASAVGNPVGGWLADRFGPRPTMLTGLAVAGVGAVGWATVERPWQAFAAAAVSGLGLAVSWPAQHALLATVVGPSRRSSVFAVGHMTLNLGLGAGGMLSALIVDVRRPGSFVALYLLDAVSFVVALAVVAGVRVPAVSTGAKARLNQETGSTKRLLRDRVYLKLCGLAALLMVVGFSQFNTTLPILVTEHARLTARHLSIVFAANMIAVVIVQLLTLRVISGRRRSRAVIVLGLLWAGCWALILGTGPLGDRTVIFGAFIVVAVVFAVGETLLPPTLPAIVNDLAPDSSRGRYNGGLTLAYTTGFIVGPVLGGIALRHGLVTPLLVGLIVACLAASAVMFGLEKTLPAAANRIPPTVPEAGPVPEVEPMTAGRTEGPWDQVGAEVLA